MNSGKLKRSTLVELYRQLLLNVMNKIVDHLSNQLYLTCLKRKNLLNCVRVYVIKK
jgi:hypothetical protein